MKPNTHLLIAAVLLMSVVSFAGCRSSYHERTYYENQDVTDVTNDSQVEPDKTRNGSSHTSTEIKKTKPVIVVE